MIRAYNFESTTYRIYFLICIIFTFFHSFGKHSFSKLCLKSKNKGSDIEEAYNFNMQIEIPS